MCTYRDTIDLSYGLFQINFALPIEDVSVKYAKRLEFHLLVYRFFPKIQSAKARKSGFWAHVWVFSENLCKNKDFWSKTWTSKIIFHTKKSGNPTSSMWAQFVWVQWMIVGQLSKWNWHYRVIRSALSLTTLILRSGD